MPPLAAGATRRAWFGRQAECIPVSLSSNLRSFATGIIALREFLQVRLLAARLLPLSPKPLAVAVERALFFTARPMLPWPSAATAMSQKLDS
jgi:hypothetical protein